MHKYLMNMLTNSYKNRKNDEKIVIHTIQNSTQFLFRKQNLMKSRKIKDDYENTFMY